MLDSGRGAWYAKNDYNKALADMNAAIAARPGKADDLANRGIYKYMLLDNDGAIADYTAALHIDPAADTFANRGLALLAKTTSRMRCRTSTRRSSSTRKTPSTTWAAAGRSARSASISMRCAISRAPRSTSRATPSRSASAASPISTMPISAMPPPISTNARKTSVVGYSTLRVWRYIAQARSQGDGSDIRVQLDAKGIMGREWPAPVRSMILGRMKPEALIAAAAAEPDAKKAKGRGCEASFYIGQYHLIRGEKGPAKQRFIEAKNTCPADLPRP